LQDEQVVTRGDTALGELTINIVERSGSIKLGFTAA
jgi:hypothetical protein